MINKSIPVLVKYRLHSGKSPYFIKEGFAGNMSIDGVYLGWTDPCSYIPETLVEATSEDIAQYEALLLEQQTNIIL